jgi:hypothetical protein
LLNNLAFFLCFYSFLNWFVGILMINKALLSAGGENMLHCTDMTVLDRRRARIKWQQEQQQHQVQLPQQEISYFSELSRVFQQAGFHEGGLSEVVTRSVKPDPGLVDNGWNNDHVVGFGVGPLYDNGSGFELNYGAISRTSSCPPAVAAAATATATVRGAESVVSDKISSGVGRESSKKRKFDKVQNNSKLCVCVFFFVCDHCFFETLLKNLDFSA